jgi:hypothetical protein
VVGSESRKDLMTGDDPIVAEDISAWRYDLNVSRFFSRARRSEGAVVGVGDGDEGSSPLDAGRSREVDDLETVGLRGPRELT